MVKIKEMWKRMSFEILCVMCLLFMLINSGNWLSEQTINIDSEYSNLYNEKANKEFLSEEEVLHLKNLENEHIANSKARSLRMNEYYGIQFMTMLIMFFLAFWIQYSSLVVLPSLIFSPFVFLSTLILTSSFSQSLLWVCFTFIGMKLGRYLCNRKDSKEYS